MADARRPTPPPAAPAAASSATAAVGPAGIVRRALATLIRAADDSFALPAADLADMNRWLIPKSCLTCVLILAFTTLLALLGVPFPVQTIASLCAVALTLSLPFTLWLRTGRALGLLIYVQLTISTLLLTAGLAALTDWTVLLHLQFLMVVITAALLSVRCGLLMTALVIAAHLFLVTLRPAPTILDVLLPVYFLAVAAHQCFFYGARLVTKTRQAEDESTVASALLRVADELAAERTSSALVQRLALLAKEITGGSWAGVALHDPERRTFAIRALITRLGIIDEEVLSVGLPANLAIDPRLVAAQRDGCILCDGPDRSLLPAELHERWRAGCYLASVLRRTGDPVGMLFVGFDDDARLRSTVSRRLVVGMARQALLALDNARLFEDLEQASSLKSEFISTISHELRSPLHAIIGYTEILREEANDAGEHPPHGDMLERVRVHALHLHEMIEATLSVSRLESGRLPLRLARVVMQELCDEIAAEIPDFRRKPEVELCWDVDADLPPLESDAGKLKMIVRNLVENGLKFTDAGSVTVRASLDRTTSDEVGDDHAMLRIVVRDTGIGIAPEMHAAVFEMYRQGDGSLTRRHAGIGLGLYIVRRLVEALRGRIELESTPGEGTTFRVALPVAVANAVRAVA